MNTLSAVPKADSGAVPCVPSLPSTGAAPACAASVAAGRERVPTKLATAEERKLKMTIKNVLVAAVVIIGLSGCSSFHRDWRKASATPALAGSIEGRWQGSWVSGVNRHQGRLRCLVSQLDRGHYQARFHAKYRKILSFGYTVLLAVEEHDGACKFQGGADLGRLAGGQYQYEGTATPANFFSTYRSQYDHGTFQMMRP